MPTLTTRSGWRRSTSSKNCAGDLGVDERDRQVLVDEVGGGAGERLRGSWSCLLLHLGDDRVRPAGAGAVRACSRASWSRPSTVAACQPSAANRGAIRARPVVARRRVVDDHHGQRVQPSAPASSIASGLLPSSSSASPTSTTTRESMPCARRPSAVPTASGSPWPSEPLEISTPGTRPGPGGGPAASRTSPSRPASPRGRSPSRRASRSRPSGRAPWRGRTGPARGRRGSPASRRGPGRRAPRARPASRSPRRRASRRRSSATSAAPGRRTPAVRDRCVCSMMSSLSCDLLCKLKSA